MQTFSTKAQLRAALLKHHRKHDHVVLVPTMGALHAGHRALLEQERRGFVERQLKSLQEQMKVRSAKIMGEITKITEGIATKGNYDLVLDKSAQALRSNQVFVYTKPGMDITPTVMKELNKDAPEGFDPSKKKAPAVPAAPAAPAN